MNTKRIVFQAVVAGLLLAIFAVPRAHAVADCNSTCSSNCSLTADVNCNGADGIVLSSGADFDLNGHTMTCTANCPTAAVKIAASGSIVKNTSGTEAVITGPFNNAVNCQDKSGSQVTGIRIVGASVGANLCAKVEHNVFIGPGNSGGAIGAYTDGIANTDFISDNYFEDWGISIAVNTDHDLLVQHNQIFVTEVGTTELGINFTPGFTGTVDLLNNSFFGSPSLADYIGIVNGSVIPSGNFCDPSTTICQNCIFCQDSVAPFNP
jgi:hypothetical protein